MPEPLDNFTEIPFTIVNLDRYIIRKSILKGIQESLKNFKGKLLDIGCGKMPYKHFILNGSSVESYIGLDIDKALQYDENVTPDFTWDGKTMPFENESFDTTLATEVLEHCSEPQIFLDEIHRVMKNGACFFSLFLFYGIFMKFLMMNTVILLMQCKDC